MKHFLIICISFMTIACSGENIFTPDPPEYNGEVKDFTVVGDSTGNDLGYILGKYIDVDNQAIDGARIDLYLDNPDPRFLRNIVLMIGVNNFWLAGEGVDVVFQKYESLYDILYSQSDGNIYCVSLSPETGGRVFTEDIQDINILIKNLCSKYYIDSWAVYKGPDDLVDGIHHAEQYDERIAQEIIKRIPK